MNWTLSISKVNGEDPDPDEARVSIEEGGGGGEYEPNLFFITINISTHLINNKISTIKKHKTTIS